MIGNIGMPVIWGEDLYPVFDGGEISAPTDSLFLFQDKPFAPEAKLHLPQTPAEPRAQPHAPH